MEVKKSLPANRSDFLLLIFLVLVELDVAKATYLVFLVLLNNLVESLLFFQFGEELE